MRDVQDGHDLDFMEHPSTMRLENNNSITTVQHLAEFPQCTESIIDNKHLNTCRVSKF